MEAAEEYGIDLDALLKDQDKLQEVLKYHVVAGAVASGDLKDKMQVETLQGGTIEPQIMDDGSVVIKADKSEAMVVVPDIKAGAVSSGAPSTHEAFKVTLCRRA